MKSNPFLSRRLRNWMFKGVRGSRVGIEDVSLMGEGPFSRDDMTRFLRRRRIEVLTPDFYTQVLVIGEQDWIERDIRRLLAKRSGQTLRVYSQDMFLMYLLSSRDPLERPALARRIGKGHPALQLLMSIGFKWPITKVTGFGDGSGSSGNWRSEGFLKAIGYEVGYHAGNHPIERRRVLTRAYRANVPDRFGREYSEHWGDPRSSVRLQRIAHSVARFARLAYGRRVGDFSLACKQWERDLAWLKRSYYDGRQQFEWPSIQVW